MPVLEGAILDYNGTYVRGYHEIPLAYKFLGRAILKGNLRRALRLAFPLQYRCWKLIRQKNLEGIGEVFAEDVLPGEDVEYLERFGRDFNISKSLLRVLPKTDTRPIQGARDFVGSAYFRMVRTAIYSSAIRQFIEANLERSGDRALFDTVVANSWLDDDGKVYMVENRVGIKDKGGHFPSVLEDLDLRETGEGVLYCGDSDADKPVFNQVEYPMVSPAAKDDFKESCKADPDFGDRILVVGWEEASRKFGLN